MNARIQSLLRTAEENGTVKVIVGTRVPFAAEGRLRTTEARQQRTEIASASTGLRNRFSAAISRAPRSFRSFNTLPFVALEVTPQELQRLAADPQVISIAENITAAPSLVESVPLVGAAKAHDAGYDGSGKVIAILDTGIDKNHPFLGNRIVAEACFSKGGWCPNGATQSTAAGAGMPCPLPKCNHGTHVAGIAAGSGLNPGVAPGARLISIQVFSPVQNEPRSYVSDNIAGLEHVAALRFTHPIVAANMSLGGGQYFAACDQELPALAAAIENLSSHGIATIVASGNDGFTNSLSQPACISKAVSVGAVYDVSPHSNRVASFSNSANMLSLLAPGAWIISSVTGGAYGSMSGTSMAAPHVAGAWAVLKQKIPNASVAETLGILRDSGTPLIDGRNGLSTPRINVRAALDATTSLSYARTGSGKGSVTLAPDGGAGTCSGNCTAHFVRGTQVRLSVEAAPGSTFTGWSGACTGTGPCAFTMTEHKSVSAEFSGLTYGLTYQTVGSGTINASAEGSSTSCSDICTASYGKDTIVTLTATAAPGHGFTGWSGDCGGADTCTLAMTQARNVTASFAPLPDFAITYTRNGTGTGSVMFTAGEERTTCTESCSLEFKEGTQVTLTAMPAAGSTFISWSGDCSGTSCTVVMTGAKSITADFTLGSNMQSLSFTRSGTGAGTVSFSPAGNVAACSESCTTFIARNTTVTLRAAASAGSVFKGWSGACKGKRTCRIRMSQARAVAAVFDDIPERDLRLVFSGSGTGRVSFSPQGSVASCSEDCTGSFLDRTRVTLTATPADGSRFTGWSGACRGTRVCRLTMSAAKSVTANFRSTQSASSSEAP